MPAVVFFRTLVHYVTPFILTAQRMNPIQAYLRMQLASNRYPILNLGFRPFFAGAAIYSVVSTLAWTGMYIFGLLPNSIALPQTVWHAHEMIFGYCMAVIAGFLLTAAGNWTGVQTVTGTPLLLLFLLWLGGRLLLASGNSDMLQAAAICDGLFGAGLVIAILVPVIRVRQWQQLGIVSKIVLLVASNMVFYAGTLGLLEDGSRIGLYSGIYIVMALIFVMGRRVIPFFIEKGVGYPVQVRNRAWVDIASLVLFLGFWIADVLQPDTLLVATLSAALLALHILRLIDWHTPGIWRRPLLWVLYIGYGWLGAGFALKTAVPLLDISPLPALHAFAYGGIGMITLGMMSRVSLGHTGRNVFEPPPVLFPMFAVLLAGAVCRVALPLLDTARHVIWIGISQCLWIVAFCIFLAVYLPMLARPRADGQPG